MKISGRNLLQVFQVKLLVKVFLSELETEIMQETLIISTDTTKALLMAVSTKEHSKVKDPSKTKLKMLVTTDQAKCLKQHQRDIFKGISEFFKNSIKIYNLIF